MSHTMLLLLPMMLVAVGIHVAVGDCPDNYIVIFIKVNGKLSQICDVKGSDIAKAGSSVPTQCDITCTCDGDVITCCKEENCMEVEENCSVTYHTEKKQLTCSTDNMIMVATDPYAPQSPLKRRKRNAKLSRIVRLLSLSRHRRDLDEEETTEEEGVDGFTEEAK